MPKAPKITPLVNGDNILKVTNIRFIQTQNGVRYCINLIHEDTESTPSKMFELTNGGISKGRDWNLFNSLRVALGKNLIEPEEDYTFPVTEHDVLKVGIPMEDIEIDQSLKNMYVVAKIKLTDPNDIANSRVYLNEFKKYITDGDPAEDGTDLPF